MMKTFLPLLFAFMLFLIACEKPKPSQKDMPIEEAPRQEPIEQVVDETDSESLEIKIPNTELGFLVTYENKYATQEDLFKNEVFANRLKQLDRFNYDALLQFYNTETPIVIIDNIVHMSGCKQHSCPDNAYDFFIDLTNDNINVYYFRSNMLRIYKENEMIDLPEVFAQEMEIKKSNAKIGEVDDTESTYSLTDGQ